MQPILLSQMQSSRNKGTRINFTAIHQLLEQQNEAVKIYIIFADLEETNLRNSETYATRLISHWQNIASKRSSSLALCEYYKIIIK